MTSQVLPADSSFVRLYHSSGQCPSKTEIPAQPFPVVVVVVATGPEAPDGANVLLF